MDERRYTVRGFIDGTVKRKLGIAVTATKAEGRGTVYSIATNA